MIFFLSDFSLMKYTWKTAVGTLISINLKPLKPAKQLPKKMVHYVFQVIPKPEFFSFGFFLHEIWVFPKIMVPPNHHPFNRGFPLFSPSILGVSPPLFLG